MPLLGVEREHALRLAGEDQRHGEHGDELLLPRDLGLQIPLFLHDIDDRERLVALDHRAEQGVLDAEIRLLAVKLAAALASAQDELRGVIVKQEDRADARLHQPQRLHGDLVEDFVEVRLGDDHLGDIDEAGELPPLDPELVDLPRELEPLRRLQRHVHQPRLVDRAEGIDLGGIDVKQPDDLPAHLDRHRHFGADARVDGDVALLRANVAAAQRLAGGRDPAGDALARPQLHAPRPLAKIVAGLDVEEAGVRVDENERARFRAGRANGGGENAVERLLGMEQRAQVAPAQAGEDAGRGARGRARLYRAMRARTSRVSFRSTSSDSIFLPFLSHK